MFKIKIFSILFLIFLICLVPNVVSATSIETETLDLTDHETEDNLADRGWKWDNETKTLTLRNANFDVEDNNPCIKCLEADKITVIFEGTNTLKSQKELVIRADGDMHGSITFKGAQGAILNLQITEVNGVNIGRTIGYAYDLNILSGTINSRGGFFVDGSINISGGNLNIDAENMTYGSASTPVQGLYALLQVKITGGNVNVKANAAAIIVPGNNNPIIGDNVTDGLIITGGNIYLSSQKDNHPAIYVGNYRKKNIVIEGGNITLAGGYGLYTQNGVIALNGFESFNADGVKHDVFKVAEKDGNEIIYADADYSKVDEAIAKANNLNKANYKDFSAVEQAINAVIGGKNILAQDEVNAMEKAIINAINALELKDADYSKVDAAIAKANNLNKANYKNFIAVEKAINAIIRGRDILSQDEVNAMEKAIIDAINALEYLDADYSKVDEAIAKANDLNKDDYKDFSGVEEAINSVIRGKDILAQDEVNAMEKAIIDAINALELKGEIDDIPETGVTDFSIMATFIALGAFAVMVVLNKNTIM